MKVKRFLLVAGAMLVLSAYNPASALAQGAPPNWQPVSPHPQLSSAGTAWLGVSLERLSPYYRRYYRVPFQYGGVLVRSIQPNSPAARAGLMQGDVIVRIDGKYMYRPQDVVNHVRATRAGQRIRVDLYRYGAWKPVTVKLGAAPSGGPSPSPWPGTPPVRTPPTPGWMSRMPGPGGRVVRELLKQIKELRREIQVLKKKVAKLERRITGAKTAPAPRTGKSGDTSPGAGSGNDSSSGSGTVPPPAPPSP